MEKIKLLANLGFKYLSRHKRRYAFLFAALVFCFAVVTFITSSKDSMYNNVYYSAQSHYAGDIIAVGYNNDNSFSNYLGSDDVKSILEAVDESGIKPIFTVKRTYYNTTGIVYFNGTPVFQKYIIGCDWNDESHLFSKMDFLSQINYPLTDNCIVISAPVAEYLNARSGDVVTLEIENKWGQKNTGDFIINGIVRDFSIFGYFKVFVSRQKLNRMIYINDDDCSVIGFFLNNPSSAESKRIALQDVLKNKMQTGPLVYNRDERSRKLTNDWVGTKVFLYTLPVYLSEVSDLMGAMDMVAYFLYGIMLVIILVSASVTYRLILHERIREIGIMRSIGFYSNDVKLILWTEIFILALISIAAGFVFSLILSIGASFISFSWFPSFEIFLKNGKLTPLFLIDTVILNIVLTLVILVLAVVFPAERACGKKLPSLLSGESL